jgi:hypothetical protein
MLARSTFLIPFAMREQKELQYLFSSVEIRSIVSFDSEKNSTIYRVLCGWRANADECIFFFTRFSKKARSTLGAFGCPWRWAVGKRKRFYIDNQKGNTHTGNKKE